MATCVGSRAAVFAPAAARALRRALLASAALAFTSGISPGGLTTPAAAQGYGYYSYPSFNPYRSFNPYLDPDVERRPVIKHRPKPVSAPESETDPPPSRKGKSRSNQKPEPAKEAGPKGPLQIVVSIANQHVTLYGNGTRVSQSAVSTGVPGRPTPTGVFSIIQKDRFHHSNLYSNAPMPYMERITWSGVALHEGPLPGYPASHGCIRLTHEFAARLWVTAKLGVRVIVARNEVVPLDFAHPRLFAPKVKPEAPPTEDDKPEAAVTQPVKLAQRRGAGAAEAVESSVPDAEIPASPNGGPQGGLRGTVKMPASGAVESSGTAPPAAGATQSDVSPTSPADPAKPVPDVADPVKVPPLPPFPKARSANQPPKHAGTVAVFISRREKKIFVRQGFVPLFDVPVEIEHPEQPFGTHVFTALGLTDDGAQMRWNVMTMPSETRPVTAPKSGRTGHFEARPAEPYAPQTPAQVLDRIQIPQAAVDRIDEILTPGASLVLSDQGLGPETGEGTDFIVLVR